MAFIVLAAALLTGTTACVIADNSADQSSAASVDLYGHGEVKVRNDEGGYVKCGMNANHFEDLATRIQQTSPSQEKVSTLKRAVPPNRLTSEQVRVVLMLLASDNDRVDAASYVYPSVCDKTSFYIVYDALTFDTAKKELDEKIKAYKDH